MVKSNQTYARERQNIIRSVRLSATLGTLAREELLSLSPVKMGVGTQILVSTALTKRLQNLSTVPLVSTFLLRVVVLGQPLSGKKWERKITVARLQLAWNLQECRHGFRKEQTVWYIQQLILPKTRRLVLCLLQYTFLNVPCYTHHQMESYMTTRVDISTEVSVAFNAILDLFWKDPTLENVSRGTTMKCTGRVPQQDAKLSSVHLFLLPTMLLGLGMAAMVVSPIIVLHAWPVARPDLRVQIKELAWRLDNGAAHS